MKIHAIWLKSTYVRTMQTAAKLTKHIGLSGFLHKHKGRRLAHWLLSLGAIHDLDAMIALDVPWWSYDAIEKVDKFMRKNSDTRVFEYGSGASTVWLSRRAAHVTSVEHDRNWLELLKQRTDLVDNVDLLLREGTNANGPGAIRSHKTNHTNLDFSAYVNAISEDENKYDIIIIDGRAREACLKAAVSHLAKGGMIVFDNSTRQRYQQGIHAIQGQVQRLKGMVPSLPYPDETSLIFLNEIETEKK